MDIYSLTIIGAFIGLLVLDIFAPARSFAEVRHWRLIGVVSFVTYFVLASYLPFLWDDWLGKYQLFDATQLGTGLGVLLGVLSLQLCQYAWHRFLHGSNFMWRFFHQMHHSAERVDVAGAFYFSPLDMVGFTFSGSLALVLVVGVTPVAAAIATVIVTLLATLGHANIRTPHWLGYIVQRPENHALHHQRGVHRYNYADLAIIDMIFGTWKNPRTWEEEGGFFEGSTMQIVPMLAGRDVEAIPVPR